MKALGACDWGTLVHAAALVSPPDRFDPDTAADSLDRCHALPLVRWLHLHRVEPAAARNLCALNACPPDIRSALAGAARDNALRALGAARSLGEVGGAFAAAGIPWLCLKGPVVSVRYYGGLTQRHVGDLDLLVEPRAVGAADQCLRALGYAPVDHRPPWRQLGRLLAPVHEVSYVHPSATPVELHHRLHPNPCLVPIHAGRLLAGSERVLIAGAQIPALDVATEIIYLATHGARHAWCRLQWVLDMAVLALREPEVCTEALVHARTLGVERPLLDGLMLAENLFGTALPKGVRAAAKRSRRLRYLHAYSRLSLLAARDEAGLPVGRTHSSFLASLCQADGLRYATHQVWLRARHEVAQRVAGTVPAEA